MTATAREARFRADTEELGRRVAVYLSNESEGWGAWANVGRLFGLDVAALDVHSEWLPSPHPDRGRVPFVPQQRTPRR